MKKGEEGWREELLIPYGTVRRLEFLFDKPITKIGHNCKTNQDFEYHIFCFKDLEDSKEYFKSFSVRSNIGQRLLKQAKKGEKIELSCEKSLHEATNKEYPRYFVKPLGSADSIEECNVADLD